MSDMNPASNDSFNLEPGQDYNPSETGDNESTTELITSSLQSNLQDFIFDGNGCLSGLSRLTHNNLYGSTLFAFGEAYLVYELGLRDTQQDALCVFNRGFDNKFFAAVADGLGGEQSGEEGSDSAIHAFKRALDENKSLQEACEHARLAIDRGLTTFGAIEIDDQGYLNLSYIGDSPIMIIRDGKLLFASKVHSHQQVYHDAILSALSSPAKHTIELHIDTEQVKLVGLRELLEDYDKATLKTEKGRLKLLFDYMCSIIATQAESSVHFIDYLTTVLCGNRIYRSLGLGSIDKFVTPDSIKLKADDIVIVATDGITSSADFSFDSKEISFDTLITDEMIVKIVDTLKEPEQIAQALKRQARALGSTDNLAMIVLKYTPRNKGMRWTEAL